MKLSAAISASPYDADYDMALMHCFDSVQNYCFSLTRAPNSDEIEVMVVDQVNHKTDDLTLQLHRNHLKAIINSALAKLLDGHEEYVIEFTANEQEHENLQRSLEKIFEGKKGLSICTF
ncbi:hypothetical protein ACPA1H_15410 [Ectopseudomonas chengduensis]